ncbi:MAG: AAA family ATPase [Anaerolineae bacterium]|nr:MAG: AAA family ATPase [Anaerolineae bacterium]
MGKTIAVAGKGGVGKTLISALLINHLSRQQDGAVLAIDADPSTNLHLALGINIDFDQLETVGGIREETATDVQSGSNLGGMSKPAYFEMRIQQAIWEENDFDLLAMGRPEGPGCYCAANNMLRASIDRLSGAYQYVVIDNEAGLEHLSRRTTRDVDVLLIVSDASMRSVLAAAGVSRLIDELHTKVGEQYLIVNRVPLDESGQPRLPEPLREAIEAQGLKLAGLIPVDPVVAEFDAVGQPVGDIPADSATRQAFDKIVASIPSLN